MFAPIVNVLNRCRKGLLNGSKGAYGGSAKGRFYRMSLVMFFIVSGVPGLITGALLYGFAGGRVESELLQLHYRQIEQRSRHIDDQFSNLEMLLSHWAFDTKFDYSLNGLDFVRRFDIAADMTKTLIAMEGSNSLVKRAELYVEGKQPVLFHPEYLALDEHTAASVYEPLVRDRNIAYWKQMAFDPAYPERKDLTLVHHIPGSSMEPFGVLLFRFDSDKIANLLNTMMPYSDGESFLLQNTGDLFVSASGSASNSPLVQALRDKIQALGAPKGSFFYDWNGLTYTVSYGQLSRIAADWTYVSASPITNITSPVIQLSKLIIAISLIALLLAAFLSWLASRRIYSPVGRLVTMFGQATGVDGKEDEFALIETQWQRLHKESHELSHKLAEQLPHVRDGFLHRLLHGYLYSYTEEDLQRRMDRFNWDVKGRHYVVLFVQLVGIASPEGKFRDGDEGLVTFAAVNMMEELASQHFEQCGTINFHDLTAGLLLMVPEDRSYAEAVRAFYDELAVSVNRILKMRVTMAVSRPSARLTDVPLAFERTKQAVAYRTVASSNQLIDMETVPIEEETAVQLQYPFALERELVQALRLGSAEEASKLLDLFMEALCGEGAKEFDVQQGMLQLFGSVQHAILVSGIHPNRLFKGTNPYEQLSQLREPQLMLEWFREKVFTPYTAELAGRSDAQVKRMIEQAMLYIQEHYALDLSLEQCAEHVGMNPFYLSKSFKQVTGKNFIDYLTELRMEKAKELLRESELKIQDVAERVGYQHSYFNRIFKKLEGMTPSRYRELSRDG
ncbi:helix-turn-helix domain-containing protein [Paenibacillus chartarius]|uniref:Helix-turn-helix domain-containing protein n=1 Tax=Paenibacillus chartarius TaxID=747481 RepID=A0ABV6DH87_9BACL